MEHAARHAGSGRSIRALRAVGLLAGLLFGAVGIPGTGLCQPYPSENDLIEVMFSQESVVRLRGGQPVDLGAQKGLTGLDQLQQQLAGSQWERICDVPETRLDEIQSLGEANTGQPVYNLNNIYRLRTPKGQDIWAISQELEALPGVILARPVPKPTPPPYPPPDFVPIQGYLRDAGLVPSGIGMDLVWTLPGGNGVGVNVCDLEYSWNYAHGDISKAPLSQINNNVADPFGNTDHGTAVIGELVSDANGMGTTGICYGSNLKTCGTYYGLPPSWNVPGALAVAIANLTAGDVILLEQQWEYTPGSGNYIPIEWWLNYSPSAQTFNGVYAAITNAVALGIHVVEAGGNGNVNMNAMVWFGNSGAIIVGAGGAYPGGAYPEADRQRLSFSSYGARFDLQGWGEDVVTTGYGGFYGFDGVNYYYTNSFSGTSSASPIVAGAVAAAMGYWKTNFNGPLPTPAYMRSTLVATGTPQIMPPVGNIGPRPNLWAAINSVCQCPCHGDPQCDGIPNVQDVVQTVNVAFRGSVPVFDPQCPHERTDVSCDNVSTVVDVVKVVNVAFRGASAAGEFCTPCP